MAARQRARLDAAMAAGNPTDEVAVAWSCYQQLRAAYNAINPTTGRSIAEKVLASFPDCPIPEVARLGRTMRAWQSQVLAYFATPAASATAAQRPT